MYLIPLPSLGREGNTCEYTADFPSRSVRVRHLKSLLTTVTNPQPCIWSP